MLRVAIIGIGRVGGALARVLALSDAIKIDLYDRDKVIEASSIESDAVVLSVPDSQVATIVEQVSPKLAAVVAVLHTSGALTSGEISGLRTTDRGVGSMHPLVSLNGDASRPNPFEGAFFGIEGDPGAMDAARKIVSALGANAFVVPADAKPLYHAAAVAACGHVTALFDLAVEMMRKAGVEDAEKVLSPLVQSTLANIAIRGTAEALTGTFARADEAGLKRQIEAFDGRLGRDEREIYFALGLRSLELALANGASADAVNKMRDMIAMAKDQPR